MTDRDPALLFSDASIRKLCHETRLACERSAADAGSYPPAADVSKILCRFGAAEARAHVEAMLRTIDAIISQESPVASGAGSAEGVASDPPSPSPSTAKDPAPLPEGGESWDEWHRANRGRGEKR